MVVLLQPIVAVLVVTLGETVAVLFLLLTIVGFSVVGGGGVGAATGLGGAAVAEPGSRPVFFLR